MFLWDGGIDVRRADSFPELRAIDWWKAARCVKTKGVRRAARARIDDMMEDCGKVRVLMCEGVDVVFAGLLACQFGATVLGIRLPGFFTRQNSFTEC
jgi:hypothetical protein